MWKIWIQYLQANVVSLTKTSSSFLIKDSDLQLIIIYNILVIQYTALF